MLVLTTQKVASYHGMGDQWTPSESASLGCHGRYLGTRAAGSPSHPEAFARICPVPLVPAHFNRTSKSLARRETRIGRAAIGAG